MVLTCDSTDIVSGLARNSNTLGKFLQWLYSLGHRPTPRAKIELSQRGIAIFQDGHRIAFIPTAKIVKVTAFKRDLLTVDLICVALDYEGDSSTQHLELNEEMDGFAHLLSQLERTPDFLTDWRNKVALPPFATNATVLWERRHTSDHLLLG